MNAKKEQGKIDWIGAVIVMITASFMKDAKKYMENLEEGKIRNKK